MIERGPTWTLRGWELYRGKSVAKTGENCAGGSDEKSPAGWAGGSSATATAGDEAAKAAKK
ncbi:hypothetical protein [Streptomyces olivoreticuli]|uniref:hypothetical protein n=1 Tax=Streptomyces olivoreticuli TaxID=68246 RepID=UPI0013C30CB6|nr:hypothetical protein [Streptomyces olivoreticuli]